MIIAYWDHGYVFVWQREEITMLVWFRMSAILNEKIFRYFSFMLHCCFRTELEWKRFRVRCRVKRMLLDCKLRDCAFSLNNMSFKKICNVMRYGGGIKRVCEWIPVSTSGNYIKKTGIPKRVCILWIVHREFSELFQKIQLTNIEG